MSKCTRVHVWAALFSISLLLFLFSLFGTLGIYWRGGCQSEEEDTDLPESAVGRPFLATLPQSLNPEPGTRLRPGDTEAGKRFLASFPCDAANDDPLLVHKPLSAAKQTCIAFAYDTKVQNWLNHVN